MNDTVEHFFCFMFARSASAETKLLTLPEDRNRYLTYTSDMMELSRDGRAISQ